MITNNNYIVSDERQHYHNLQSDLYYDHQLDCEYLSSILDHTCKLRSETSE
jgi:hypothetical protein